MGLAAGGGRLAGLIVGALVGLPMMAISLVISQTDMLPFLSLAWIMVVFLVWGRLLDLSYTRLVSITEAEPSSEVSEAVRLNRRKFLVQLGASTAVITVAGAGIGSVLARAEARRREAELLDDMTHEAEPSSASPFPNVNRQPAGWRHRSSQRRSQPVTPISQ